MANQKNTTAKKETVAKTNVAAAVASVAAKKPETAAPAAKAADTTVKKTEAPKAAEKKAPVKKAEAPKKTAPKAAAKKAEPKKRGRKPAAAKKAEARVQEVYFEFGEKQVEAGALVSKVEQAYKEAGHQIGRIKDLKVYVNPDESKAYYVINGEGGDDKYIEL